MSFLIVEEAIKYIQSLTSIPNNIFLRSEQKDKLYTMMKSKCCKSSHLYRNVPQKKDKRGVTMGCRLSQKLDQIIELWVWCGWHALWAQILVQHFEHNRYMEHWLFCKKAIQSQVGLWHKWKSKHLTWVSDALQLHHGREVQWQNFVVTKVILNFSDVALSLKEHNTTYLDWWPTPTSGKDSRGLLGLDSREASISFALMLVLLEVSELCIVEFTTSNFSFGAMMQKQYSMACFRYKLIV